MELPAGTLLLRRYEVLEPLGRGGMGVVYRARDVALGMEVAVKALRPELALDPGMAERFKSEIRLARRVRHRNVCTIHDYGEGDGVLFLTMELIDGTDLKRLLRESGGLDPERAYDIGIALAEGLQAVHEAGIVHCDLKTANVMVDREGTPRLMDFGIARTVRSDGATLTVRTTVVGTPDYMSPEQAQAGRIDARSDLYAFGIVLWEMFTGGVPFRGDTPISTLLKHINEPVPLTGPAAAKLPPALRPALARLLAKDPAHRPATAREVALALQSARTAPAPGRSATADTVVVTRRTAATPARAAPATRPRSPAAVVVGLVALAALGAGVFFYAARNEAPSEPATAGLPVPPESPRPPAPSASPSPAEATPPSAPPPSPTPFVREPPRVRPTPSRVVVPAARPAESPEPAPSPPPSAAPTPEPAPANGFLQIGVVPWGEVAIDGVVVGTTPLGRVPLAPGSHTVRIRHPRFGVAERTVVVRPGQVASLVVDLSQ
jgi:serine/threonine-protein kinase